MHREHDHVLEDAIRFLVAPAHELIDRLDELVGAEHFRRVEPAVDPDDRLPFLRQRARLRLRDPFRGLELLRDLLVTRELREILRRGDDGR